MNKAMLDYQKVSDIVRPTRKCSSEEENILLYDKRYSPFHDWIKKACEKKIPWEKIYFGNGDNIQDLEKFLSNMNAMFYTDISTVDFQMMVFLYYKINSLTWPAVPSKNLPEFPTSSRSGWSAYESLLHSKPSFTPTSIKNISDSTQYLMSFLLGDDAKSVIKRDVNNPVRGMVVGNVQSGKTANMEALMAFASDYHYNFFVILTGSINNLKEQTRLRIVKDFNDKMMKKFNCQWNYKFIDNPSLKSASPDRLQDLNLEEKSSDRYICVCLKNATRLKNLRDWLNKDPIQKKKLNILFIDDEADQASVNTQASKNKQTKISGLIKSIVFGKDKSGKSINPYGSFVYAGYTATPYGNFLNEANDASLYPTDFIYGLHSPKEYFGPQTIFSTLDVSDDVLPIVNTISKEEKDDVAKQISFTSGEMVEGMSEAIRWFLCTVAIFRLWKIKSPVSMMVHTSQNVEKHSTTAKAIEAYIRTLINDANKFDMLYQVYSQQTKQLSLKEFIKDMPDYREVESIKDYPDFKDLIPYLQELFKEGIQHIMLNEEEETTYGKGVHLCVDNCKITPDDDDIVLRIVYPKNDEDLEKAPAFIVVGGQTLSRGLTLEGLTTTYFLRSTLYGDTLMQMGRWFGYRPNYELLPRIWMTEDTYEQFQHLSQLDFDLRNLIDNYQLQSWDPKCYAPALDCFPEYHRLKITAKNKMAAAIPANVSFANKRGQTTKYFDDVPTNNNNLSKAIDFIKDLGQMDRNAIDKRENPIFKTETHTHLWLNVDYHRIFTFLSELKFPRQTATVNNKDKMIEWFTKEFESKNLRNFNVLIPSREKPYTEGNKVTFDAEDDFIYPVKRQRKKKNEADKTNSVFRIPAVTVPKDLLSDIDVSTLDNSQFPYFMDTHLNGLTKRNMLGLNDTPLLILYFIDKNSGATDGDMSPDNEALSLNNNLLGYYIYIPAGKNPRFELNTVQAELEFEGVSESEGEDDGGENK